MLSRYLRMMTIAAVLGLGAGCSDFHGLSSKPSAAQADGGEWGKIAPLNVNDTVDMSSGVTAKVTAEWSSALGSPCKRVVLLPQQATRVVCQGPDGWYALRDVTVSQALR